MIDEKGGILGVMPTDQGISLANVKGLDLVLVDYNADPPICQLTKEGMSHPAEANLDETEGFSFDPTLRPASIQLSTSIEAPELERKVDILRKHLLEKRRCELVLNNRDGRSDPSEVHAVMEKILREVEDVAKSPDAHDLSIHHDKLTIRVWPCNPEQVASIDWSRIAIETDASNDQSPTRGQKGNPRKFRHIRRRVDPKILALGKESKSDLEE